MEHQPTIFSKDNNWLCAPTPPLGSGMWQENVKTYFCLMFKTYNNNMPSNVSDISFLLFDNYFWKMDWFIKSALFLSVLFHSLSVIKINKDPYKVKCHIKSQCDTFSLLFNWKTKKSAIQQFCSLQTWATD